MKKVLLIAGKFPNVSKDTDGGSIMVSHLIGALKNECVLDIVFTRTYSEIYSYIDGVNQIIFNTYTYRNDNKFLRRLGNVDNISKEIKNRITSYDKVVIVHCSKAFGLENMPKEQLDKILLFPMYLTSSYNRSNEVVPKEYTEYENRILNKVGKIITPSETEKSDIINDYDVKDHKIIVIPRGLCSEIIPKQRESSRCNKLVYIGSIKEQKKNYEAILLLAKLRERNIDAKLYLVGGIQNQEVFNKCLEVISKYDLSKNVVFTGVLSQQELASLLNDMDINISVSRWETFGRGIFEGLSAGLPTVIYSNLTSIRDYLDENSGVIFVDSLDSFIDNVYRICKDKEKYQRLSKKAVLQNEKFSIVKQNERLKEVIL